MLMSFFKRVNYQLACALNVDARDMNGRIIYDLTISCYIWVTCYTLRCEYTIINVSPFLYCTLHRPDIHRNEGWKDHYDYSKGVDYPFRLSWSLPIYFHVIPKFRKFAYFSIPIQHGGGTGDNHGRIAVFGNATGEGMYHIKRLD